jgi:hypothetical protein
MQQWPRSAISRAIYIIGQGQRRVEQSGDLRTGAKGSSLFCVHTYNQTFKCIDLVCSWRVEPSDTDSDAQIGTVTNQQSDLSPASK